MSEFENKLNNIRDTFKSNQEMMDNMFENFLKEYKITDNYQKDVIFDYCYNDYKLPSLQEIINENS